MSKRAKGDFFSTRQSTRCRPSSARNQPLPFSPVPRVGCGGCPWTGRSGRRAPSPRAPRSAAAVGERSGRVRWSGSRSTSGPGAAYPARASTTKPPLTWWPQPSRPTTA